MTNSADLAKAAQAEGLLVSGIVDDPDCLPEGAKSLCLLSPDEPKFWEIVQASPEWADGQADPIDRWSLRIANTLADAFGATVFLPFGGPPFAPFYTWALSSGRCWPSPLKLLVHDTAGLFVSFRAALAFPAPLERPARLGTKPCNTCAAPCLTTCPVGALGPDGYDTDACHAYLDRPEGRDCLTGGCLVRRACPVGADRRDPDQSAYHMSLFHP